jgi:DNA-directed RNA polymerase specialized sigma54-like protein
MQEDVLAQARLLDFSPRELILAEALLGNLDDSGYLRFSQEGKAPLFELEFFAGQLGYEAPQAR